MRVLVQRSIQVLGEAFAATPAACGLDKRAERGVTAEQFAELCVDGVGYSIILGEKSRGPEAVALAGR
ncbi:hypothetical protein [Nocardia sp. NPDC005745]|uniref:hypothetical protein n=1 Tax=Nocardia sp. NPDC005745 TaxID=3157061 RepID=UPI0034119FA0